MYGDRRECLWIADEELKDVRYGWSRWGPVSTRGCNVGAEDDGGSLVKVNDEDLLPTQNARGWLETGQCSLQSSNTVDLSERNRRTGGRERGRVEKIWG